MFDKERRDDLSQYNRTDRILSSTSETFIAIRQNILSLIRVTMQISE